MAETEMDYEALLDKAQQELPKVTESAERFEVPKVRGHIQGNRTVISNFLAIADVLRRDGGHLLKYIQKEMAAPGELKKSGSVIFGTKVSASRLNEKILEYAKHFVICSECGKPDTDLSRDQGITFLKCNACGAKHPVKAKG
ncbi:MAG TPA: translation initiation factor IF-2 subunit beta [Candidatus Nanoarchaeia archaeon]|nr:translation initiation factor IF-2 subunit beta [Candidatus Nanoarchaeia archaeon]